MSLLISQLKELWRLRSLLRLMTIRELRARFSGTAFGGVWLYAQPVLTIAAYYLIFDVVFSARLADGAPTRSLGAYLMVGMLPWMAFADALSRSAHSLVEAGGVLQKNALAPALFPAKAVLSSAATYLPPMALVALVTSASHGISAALVIAPILFVSMFMLAFVLGYALAIMAAAMRDVLQVVTFSLALGIFVSPALYTIGMIPAAYRWLIWINPMTPVITGLQDILLGARAPKPEVWVALVLWLAVLGLLLGRLVRRSDEHLVDWL